MRLDTYSEEKTGDLRRETATRDFQNGTKLSYTKAKYFQITLWYAWGIYISGRDPLKQTKNACCYTVLYTEIIFSDDCD